MLSHCHTPHPRLPKRRAQHCHLYSALSHVRTATCDTASNDLRSHEGPFLSPRWPSRPDTQKNPPTEDSRHLLDLHPHYLKPSQQNRDIRQVFSVSTTAWAFWGLRGRLRKPVRSKSRALSRVASSVPLPVPADQEGGWRALYYSL